MSDSERHPRFFERLGRRVDESLVTVPRFVMERVASEYRGFKDVPPYGKGVAVVLVGSLVTGAFTAVYPDSPVPLIGVATTVVAALATIGVSNLRRG